MASAVRAGSQEPLLSFEKVEHKQSFLELDHKFSEFIVCNIWEQMGLISCYISSQVCLTSWISSSHSFTGTFNSARTFSPLGSSQQTLSPWNIEFTTAQIHESVLKHLLPADWQRPSRSTCIPHHLSFVCFSSSSLSGGGLVDCSRLFPQCRPVLMW